MLTDSERAKVIGRLLAIYHQVRGACHRRHPDNALINPLWPASEAPRYCLLARPLPEACGPLGGHHRNLGSDPD